MRNAWILGFVLIALPSCSSSDEPSQPLGGGTDASDWEDGQGSDSAAADSGVADQSSESADGDQDGADPDVTGEESSCVPVDFTPTAQDIRFQPKAKMPAGEQLVVGKWSTSYGKPDVVTSMQPDGSGETTLFEVFRVWSMGVSRAVDRIAFSTAEPEQAKHTCIEIGDAIQHTWIYDIATQKVELYASGLINDECHLFGPGDKYLYVCRRYDWQPGGSNKGYTVGRILLADKSFEFLTHEQGYDMSLHGVPSEDESWLYYTLIKMPANTRTIMRMPLGAAPDAGAAEVFRDDAYAMALSPDGTRYVFADSTDSSALYVSNLDGTGLVKVADANGNEATFSPDGTRLAYLVWDQDALCSHIEVVKTDGSEASTPARIHDCAKAGDSPAELAWVVRP